MAKQNVLQRLVVALVFALIATLITYFFYKERDQIFEWSWTKAHGSFDSSPNEKLGIAALAFAESENPGKACVGKWLGKDDRYLYLALGCARFEEKLGEVKALGGDSNFVATRLRFYGEKVLSMERPQAKSYQNGLRRLFPREAAEKLRFLHSAPDFYRLGMARMMERHLDAAGLTRPSDEGR